MKKLVIILLSGAIYLLGVTSALAVKYNEAPMLRTKVAAGELSPVEQRLPKEPLVVKPVEEIGQYGGTWHRLHMDPDMGWWKQINWANNGLVHLTRDISKREPNLATGWKFNEDGTVCTIYLREGVKWSDGYPLTVDDILFWWNDLSLDETYPMSAPGWMRGSEKELPKVRKIDDYTIEFTYSAPNTLLPYQFVNASRSLEYIRPKHYLKKFHPKYNPEVKDVKELVLRVDNPHQFPNYPVFTPWKTILYEPGKRMVAERNAYYWKVDTEGNQLPYIDRVESIRVEDKEMMLFKIMGGEVDAQFREFVVRDIPLLKENEERGNYRVIFWHRGEGGNPMWLLNWTHKNPDMRKLIEDQKFRAALSLAIDRAKQNEIIWLGLGKAKQGTMSDISPYFSTTERGQRIYKEWANLYAEHKPERAKELLSEIGVVDINGDGFREMPNGKPLKILILCSSLIWPTSVDGSALVKEDWEKIGIRTIVNNVSDASYWVRFSEGDYDIAAWGSWSAVLLATIPGCVFPAAPGPDSWIGTPLYNKWFYTGGKEGEKPLEGSVMDRLYQTYVQVLRAKNDEERTEFVLDALEIFVDEGPIFIGAVSDTIAPVLIKNDFRNVPDFGILGPWYVSFPGTANPEQFFFKID